MASNWGWPYPSNASWHPDLPAWQNFGYAGSGRVHGYHDGVDFGSVQYPQNPIMAVHSGTVTKIAYEAGFWIVVVHNDSDGYNVVYQEFASSSAQISVHVGDKVVTGETAIGTRNTDHLHLGVTKLDFDTAFANSFSPAGGWVNPIDLIKTGISQPASDGDIHKDSNDKTLDSTNMAKCYSLLMSMEQLHDNFHWEWAQWW